MDKLKRAKRTFGLFLLCAATAIALPAQTFTVLHSFNKTDGANPFGTLVQATNGNLYGTTFRGGANNNSNLCGLGCGTVFKITPIGTFTTVYSFCSQTGCTDGANPAAGLVQAADGNFYGTTSAGGTNSACLFGCGTVFKVTAGGMLTTLYNFCSQGGSGCTDGEFPEAALVQGADGNFYGTTREGGGANSSGSLGSCGTVFKITPSGTLTTLYSFCSQSGCPDGSDPAAALFRATDGSLYGTTEAGGANSQGTVFRIAPSGVLTTIYSFCAQRGCADGAGPSASLIQATGGRLYGTTLGGGAHGDGTAFKVTPSGTLTILYSFCGQGGIFCTDGAEPFSALIKATDGKLYGTTETGGTNAGGGTGGTVFKISPSGTLTTLYNSCSQSGCTDGETPLAALVQDSNGNFYGTTYEGGTGGACQAFSNGCGTIFSLSTGLLSFVETEPTSGKVGATVKILGTNLSVATSVSFNGTAAVFKVISDSLITTTVPMGTNSGKVLVVTPGRTLLSNVPFRVLP